MIGNLFQIGMEKNVRQIIEQHQQSLLPIIKKYIEHKNLLDAGCGNGLNSFLFNKNVGTKITLLDIEDIRDAEAISFPFFESSLEKLPFESGSFDVVFLQYVLHHLPLEIKLKDVFEELKRVSGMVIIVEEISTKKTNIQKAKEYDSKINKMIHSSSNYMHVYKYYSDVELKSNFSDTEMNIVEEQIFDEGCKEDGFLQRKIYVLN